MTPAPWLRSVILLPACLVLSLAGYASAFGATPKTPAVSVAEAENIARQAYIYAYPMVENYNSVYQWAIDRTGSQYKGPINQIKNVPRVFGPQDTGVVTPNSDTPYSYLIMDLRREPLVVTLPPIERDRYYSLQLVDLYSHNVDYIGTRRDGNGGGNFLVAGPGWHGKVPPHIKRVIRSDTQLMFSQFRTQRKSLDDLDNVKRIQAGYKVATLSAFAHTAAPPAPPEIDFPPISPERIETGFFSYVNFLLQFCPPYKDEKALRERFRRIGVAPGAPWPPTLAEPVLQAIARGRAQGTQAVQDAALKVTTSTGLFGTHEAMRGKYLARAVGAKVGLYGNTAAEALYPAYQLDTSGRQLDASAHDYRLTFPKGDLPPVDAFWSVTMYDGKTRLLVDNPINRYLINSNMLPMLKRNADGGVTLYLQHGRPDKDKEANWLPAPNGPIFVVLRLYLPKPEVLSGKWKAPQIEEVPGPPHSAAGVATAPGQ